MVKADNATKKFKIAIAALCVGLFALIVAFVSVWAATSQTMVTGFDITYTGSEYIVSKIKTEIYIPNKEGYESGPKVLTSDAAGNIITDETGFAPFITNPEFTSQSAHIGDLGLSTKYQKAEIYFTIKNESNAYLNVNITPTFNNINNIQFDFSFYNTYNFIEANSASTIDDSLFTTDASQNIDIEEYKVIKLTISVIDKASAASCSGGIELRFSKILEAQNV